MATILDHHAKALPTWVAITLGIAIGLGAAAVAIILAGIGVFSALAGNPSLPEVLSAWQATL